jgi:hypothetical protein
VCLLQRPLLILIRRDLPPPLHPRGLGRIEREAHPSLDAHWNAATTESLISFRYCTPLHMSMNMLGPVVSGPKHQIFLDRSLSQPNFSASKRPRILGSSRGPTSPASIASAKPSSNGAACNQATSRGM